MPKPQRGSYYDDRYSEKHLQPSLVQKTLMGEQNVLAIEDIRVQYLYYVQDQDSAGNTYNRFLGEGAGAAIPITGRDPSLEAVIRLNNGTLPGLNEKTIFRSLSIVILDQTSYPRLVFNKGYRYNAY